MSLYEQLFGDSKKAKENRTQPVSDERALPEVKAPAVSAADRDILKGAVFPSRRLEALEEGSPRRPDPNHTWSDLIETKIRLEYRFGKNADQGVESFTRKTGLFLSAFYAATVSTAGYFMYNASVHWSLANVTDEIAREAQMSDASSSFIPAVGLALLIGVVSMGAKKIAQSFPVEEWRRSRTPFGWFVALAARFTRGKASMDYEKAWYAIEQICEGESNDKKKNALIKELDSKFRV